MLVLNFCNDSCNKPVKKHKYRKKNKKVVTSYRRDSAVIKSKIFNIISLNEEHLKNEDFIKLIRGFKGRLLPTNILSIDNYLYDYIWDFKPYFKRTLLSSLKNLMKKETFQNICIYDDFFIFSDEIKEVANLCRALTVYGEQSENISKFKEYCYINYGLNIFVNSDFKLNDKTLYVDLNKISLYEDFNINTGGGCTFNLEYDNSYFEENEYIRKLCTYGVPFRISCAALNDGNPHQQNN